MSPSSVVLVQRGALAFLFALFVLRLGHAAWEKSFTLDEPHYVGTALYLWETGDYHYARSLRFHPPLAFHVAGLPLLALDLDLSPEELGPDLGGRLIHGGDPPLETIRLASRIPFVLVAVWGAVVLLLWARELSGTWAAILAVFLYTFSPTVLAHGALAHSDILVAVLYVQALYCLWRWLRRPTGPRLAAVGLGLGLAVTAKASALLLLPAVGLALLGEALGLPGCRPDRSGPTHATVWRKSSRLVARGLFIAGLVLAIIWGSYGGSFAMSPGVGGYSSYQLPAYLNALLFDVAANERGRPIFFLGELYPAGRWYFLPVAFLLKTPVGTLALLAAALLLGCRTGRGLGPLLALAIACYGTVAFFWLRVPLGLRYLLPILPLLHLIVAVRLAPASGRPVRSVLVAGCIALGASSLYVHPHYLAYFNETIGGPSRGHHYLIESNFDWGQDMRGLARYLESRGNPPIWLAYVGVERPEDYRLRSRPLADCDPVAGLVAIDANVLQGLYVPGQPFHPPQPACYSWLRAMEPVARPGYSMFVYDVDLPDAPLP